ncbi:hypothetical protein ACCO45_010028 [Purpureocillium lilacinum]|uniref:Uncharacterized protein n=1 Tax=Purpureocillium lilacinum TaxID=33203 RepID=A0ACC4DDM2_PURLI
MLSHCQHGGGLTADFGPDVVYCHDCSRCQDEAVENASCDSDAHGFDQIPPTRSSDTHISHDEAPGGFGIGGDQETLAAAGQPRVGQAREAIIGGDAPLLWVTNDSLIIAADNVSLLQS